MRESQDIDGPSKHADNKYCRESNASKIEFIPFLTSRTVACNIVRIDALLRALVLCRMKRSRKAYNTKFLNVSDGLF